MDSIVVKADGGYDAGQMDLEIQRVARELYKAFSGMNGFPRASDQVSMLRDIAIYCEMRDL